MIPILFPAGATAWTTNGLGRLSDTISAKVEEERNGSYELTLEYPVDGIHYQDLAISNLILAKPADGKGPQPFRIYKIGRPMGGRVTVCAEHLSYQLNMIPVVPFTAPSCLAALQGLKLNAAEACPFDFYTDKTIGTQWTVKQPASIRELLGGTDGSILETYRGEFEFDGYDVHLWTNRGTDAGVVIRYGKNLTNLEQEENIENTYTGIMPYWQKEDEDGTVTTVLLPERVLHSDRAANFPYQRTIPVDFSGEFEEQPTEQELRDAGEDYILANNIGIPAVNVKINFIALWQTEEYKDLAALERVNLCDTVTVRFDKLGVDVTAKVIKTNFDVLTERYNEIEVGDAKGTLGGTISEIGREEAEETARTVTAEYTTAIGQAADLLTGGLGGHVVINRNADGQPNEILIMDTDNTATATNVIRFNEAGIGFSQSGYSGPFTGFIGIGGTIDFAQIRTLNLVANMFKGGVLQLGTLDNEVGILQVFDGQNALIGQLDNDGLKMYGQDGSYVLMNNQVGFSGYDRSGTRLYWVDGQEFHMKKSVIEEEITLCGMMRYIPITLYDGGGNISSQGIAMVSSN